MGSEHTSRWKHTDTHADLRAFLGDAADLFRREAPSTCRRDKLELLCDEYGLSEQLASRAIAALELSHGDSQVAYELLTQWSVIDLHGQLVANLSNVAQRPHPIDDQETHASEIQIEPLDSCEGNSPVQPVESDQALAVSSETNLSRQFALHVEESLASNSIEQLTCAEVQQKLIAEAVRLFGLKPATAKVTLAAMLPADDQPPRQQLPRQGSESSAVSPPVAASHKLSLSEQVSPATSPDTLPDLETIMAEEADWLQRQQAEAVEAAAQPAPEQPSRDAYRDYLDQRLANIRGHQINAHQWKKLHAYGVQQYHLPAADAAHLLEERAHRVRKKVLTPERASEQLRHMAIGLYQRHGRITPKLKRRLSEVAQQMGVPLAEVHQMCETQVQSAKARPSTDHPNYRLLLSISATAACTMLAFFLWVAVSQRPAGPTLATNTAAGDNTPKRAAPTAAYQPPAWWDEQTIAAAQEVSASSRRLHAMLQDFNSAQVSRRQTAAVGFYRQIDFSPSNLRQQGEQYQQVLVGYLALEPEQSAAVETFRTIGESINTISSQWPATGGTHEALYWRLNVLIGAVESPLTSRQRAAAFATTLNNVLNVSLQASDDLLAWRNACSLALTEHCYQALHDSVDHPTAAIASAQRSLALACSPLVPPAHLARFNTKLLCSLLAGGRGWNEFEELITQRVAESDMLNALRFVAAYESMPDSPARNSLGQLLIARAGLNQQSRNPRQTARVVRTALEHGKPGDRYVDRWEHFTFASEPLLDRSPQLSHDSELPQMVLALAHQNLLGAALARHEAGGRLVFDQHFDEGAPQLSVLSEVQPLLRLSPRQTTWHTCDMPPHVAKELLRRAHLLQGSLPDRDPGYDWEIVVRIIQRWHELPPPVANLLGQYVVAELNQRTHERLIADSKLLLAMPEFQMALAEAIEGSPLSHNALAARLSSLLGQRVVMQNSDDRAKLRLALLHSVNERLAGTTTPAQTLSPTFDELRLQLTRVYQGKARLWNVSPGAYLTAGNPADMLTALIQQELASPTHVKQGRAAEYRRELSATKFRSRSELEETVLLQRLWIRALADRMELPSLDEASPLAGIVARQSGEQEDQPSLLAQLREGEAAELQLWLIRNAMH